MSDWPRFCQKSYKTSSVAVNFSTPFVFMKIIRAEAGDTRRLCALGWLSSILISNVTLVDCSVGQNEGAESFGQGRVC